MAQNESHHFIPQMYLRGFLDPEQVSKGQNLFQLLERSAAVAGSNPAFCRCLDDRALAQQGQNCPSTYSRGPRTVTLTIAGISGIMGTVTIRIPNPKLL